MCKDIEKETFRNLIESSELNKFWTLQAGIFSESNASIEIYDENGLQLVGSLNILSVFIF
jgi:L-amino acid N-acyltransferase YncA